ncbi:phosphoethanolamine transferase [Paenalcaligenes sp.]|uniref:phosphoethanolamine transferase n=1 Tax=Paenalcaligenes sp. TaxID=1966342 RepID=UPI00262E6BF9|nr:phosphoethanolamine transferase [Paenalcaligenes sp.]
MYLLKGISAFYKDRFLVGKDKFWFFLWSLVFILFFFYAAKPSLYSTLESSSYIHSSENVSIENQWSTVNSEGQGVFFVHPGEAEPVKLALKLKQRGFYKVELSIREGSSAGNIRFSVYKNNIFLSENVVLANEKASVLSLKINENDSLTIIADKNGSTAQDWGNVKILKIDYGYIYNLLSILVIWLSVFFLNYNKNQAAYVVAGFFVFVIYTLAERLTFNSISLNAVIGYSALLIACITVFSLIHSILSYFRQSSWAIVFMGLLLVLIAASPLAFISYKLSFGEPIAKEALYAIFQSNASESIEFVSDFISFKAMAFFAFSLFLVLFVVWWHRNSNVRQVNFSLWFVIFLSMTIIAGVFLPDTKMLALMNNSFKEYTQELKAFKELQGKRSVDANAINAKKTNQGETYIVVIGESLNKQHMQLYGYSRQTTPKLSELVKKGDLLKLNNAYSNHTHTMPVLSLALTEAAQDKKKDYYNSVSIVEVYKAAGFETIWLTNQNLLGAWDNLVSIIANQADKVVGINSSIGTTTISQRYDGDLLKPLNEILSKKTNKNRVIFMHLMGSHGSYCSRFPDEYAYFKGELSRGEFGESIAKSKALELAVNCYDNSVLYNDFIISEVIKSIKSSDGISSVLYFSDHADDVFRQLGHNSAMYTSSMTQIPFLIWFSEEYKLHYADIFQQFLKNKNTLFSNDRLYDTLIGWSQIKTQYYRPEFDFTSKDYQVNPQEALTLHGRKRYIESNDYYWNRYNSDELSRQNILDVHIARNVNTLAKMSELWEMGHRAFEIDVFFDIEGQGIFRTGRNTNHMGEDLKLILSRIDLDEVKAFWLNIKNLSAENYQQVLLELERINNHFPIKNKLMLKTDWSSKEASQFSRAGWNIAFHLSKDKVLGKIDSLFDKDNFLKKLAEQLSAQKAVAIAFDAELFSFFEDNGLEDRLPSHITYFLVEQLELGDPELLTKLESKKHSQDKNKIISLKVNSIFSL